MAIEFETGRRFGRLTVQKRDPKSVKKHPRWICECDCGVQKSVFQQALIIGSQVSCGCSKLEKIRKHGLSASTTYRSWIAAKSRCFNPEHDNYPRYGGSGIVMDEKWRNSFQAFVADMGERPPGTTLDRYPNVSGNYEPGNCRWATASEQTHNRRKLERQCVVCRETFSSKNRATLCSSRCRDKLHRAKKTDRQRKRRARQFSLAT